VAALDAVRPGAACAGRAYVVANGEPRTVRELLEGICTAAGVPFEPRHVPLAVALRVGSVVERVWPRLRKDEPPITRFLAEQLGTAHWFDPRPARDDLGWSPTVSLDEGLERLRQSFAG
jgi:nucleoside-diphosphate-sugar epimerase